MLGFYKKQNNKINSEARFLFETGLRFIVFYLLIEDCLCNNEKYWLLLSVFQAAYRNKIYSILAPEGIVSYSCQYHEEGRWIHLGGVDL